MRKDSASMRFDPEQTSSNQTDFKKKKIVGEKIEKHCHVHHHLHRNNLRRGDSKSFTTKKGSNQTRRSNFPFLKRKSIWSPIWKAGEFEQRKVDTTVNKACENVRIHPDKDSKKKGRNKRKTSKHKAKEKTLKNLVSKMVQANQTLRLQINRLLKDDASMKNNESISTRKAKVKEQKLYIKRNTNNESGSEVKLKRKTTSGVQQISTYDQSDISDRRYAAKIVTQGNNGSEFKLDDIEKGTLSIQGEYCEMTRQLRHLRHSHSSTSRNRCEDDDFVSSHRLTEMVELVRQLGRKSEQILKLQNLLLLREQGLILSRAPVKEKT